MEYAVEVQQIGEELRVELPSDIVERHGLKPGDTLYVVARPDGILLTPYVDAMRIYRSGAEQYRRALQTLAES